MVLAVEIEPPFVALDFGLARDVFRDLVPVGSS
jgi:hypothetical protein